MRNKQRRTFLKNIFKFFALAGTLPFINIFTKDTKDKVSYQKARHFKKLAG